MSEKILHSNPERDKPKMYYITLPDGSVGSGFATGYRKGDPVQQRYGPPLTVFQVEIQYDTTDPEGQPVTEQIMVSEYQLNEDAQKDLMQRQQQDTADNDRKDRYEQ